MWGCSGAGSPSYEDRDTDTSSSGSSYDPQFNEKLGREVGGLFEWLLSPFNKLFSRLHEDLVDRPAREREQRRVNDLWEKGYLAYQRGEFDEATQAYCEALATRYGSSECARSLDATPCGADNRTEYCSLLRSLYLARAAKAEMDRKAAEAALARQRQRADIRDGSYDVRLSNGTARTDTLLALQSATRDDAKPQTTIRALTLDDLYQRKYAIEHQIALLGWQIAIEGSKALAGAAVAEATARDELRETPADWDSDELRALVTEDNDVTREIDAITQGREIAQRNYEERASILAKGRDGNYNVYSSQGTATTDTIPPTIDRPGYRIELPWSPNQHWIDRAKGSPG